MRRYLPLLFVLLAIAAVAVAGLFYKTSPQPWLSPPPPLADSVLEAFQQQQNTIGSKEDPQARQRWEMLMLRDPKTGKLPANIRQRELQFARSLPLSKEQTAGFRTAATEWQSAGPFNIGGRTRALGIDVQNEEILLAAGVSGGMWRSTNGGASWDKTTNPLQLQSVTCLVQDTRPGHEDTWYYGSGELIGNSARGGEAPYRGDGLYKSIDNGLTWFALPATSTNEPQNFDQLFDYVFNVKIDATNPLQDELYAAATGGIFRSVDGGVSWSSSLVDSVAQFTDVETTRTGSVYASLSSLPLDDRPGEGGLYRSDDGVTWSNITPAGWPANFGRVVIASNPQNPEELYFLGYTPDGPVLWRYRHASRIWADLTINLPEDREPVAGLELQGGYNMVVKVHPQQPQTVFVGGTNLYRSDDGFTSSSALHWIGGYNAENKVEPFPNQHPDQHALVFYPSNPSRAIAGHDGGLSLSEDILAPDVTWQDLNNGYRTTQFYTVGLDQSRVNDLIIGGMQDNGSFLTPDAAPATEWLSVLGGDGGYTHVASKGAYYYVSFQNSQIYRLTLNDDYNITSFARIDPPGAGLVEDQLYLFVNPYVFDPTSKNRLYLAAGDVVYRNRNISQIPAGSQNTPSLNWERLSETEVDSGSVSAISISTTPSDILYYGTSAGEVFRVRQANSTNPVVNKLSSPLFPEFGYVAHVAVNPADGNEIIVVFSNYNVRSIFHSTNGGDTFTDIGGNLEEFLDGTGDGPSVRYVEIIPMKSPGERLFLAGTSTGLYSTRQLSGPVTSWEQEAPEVIGRVVVPQVRHRSLDGRVVVATHGNGVYYKNYDNVLNTYVEPDASSLTLGSPFPNPFRDQLIIPVDLPRDGVVRVRVYDAKGQLIKLLYYNRAFAGPAEISWDGRNVAGVPLASGMYILRMDYENETLSKRVVLVR